MHLLYHIPDLVISIGKSTFFTVWTKSFYTNILVGPQTYALKPPTLRYKQNKTEAGRSGVGRQTDVLLFGYERGETTFVGHIIGCRDDTFYFYEPLWAVSRKQCFTKTKQCDVHADLCRNYSSKSMNISNILSSLYECNTLSLKMLTSSVQSEHSCSRHRTAFHKNIPALNAICSNSRARITKVLRISAEFLKDLITHNPFLKIIYLYRDPRAISTSRRKSYKGPFKESMVKAICNKMAADSPIILKLAAEYPENVILVSAERIARYPMNVSKQLFEFLNLRFTLSDEKQINDLTNWTSNQRVIKERNFYPFKNDGYASSMKWRKVLSLEDKAIIDNLCQPVYQRLGYLNMTSFEYFRNISNLNVVNVNKHINSI